MIILLLVFASMAYIQIPGLVKNKYWKELAAFLAFFTAAFVLCLLYVLDVDIPSPMKGISYIFDDLLQIKY